MKQDARYKEARQNKKHPDSTESVKSDERRHADVVENNAENGKRSNSVEDWHPILKVKGFKSQRAFHSYPSSDWTLLSASL